MDLHLVEGQLLVAVLVGTLDQSDRTLVSFMSVEFVGINFGTT
jgi:hypothetical protein